MKNEQFRKWSGKMSGFTVNSQGKYKNRQNLTI